MRKIDLSGLWQVYLDAQKRDALPAVYPDEMMLPALRFMAEMGRYLDSRFEFYKNEKN